MAEWCACNSRFTRFGFLDFVLAIARLFCKSKGKFGYVPVLAAALAEIAEVEVEVEAAVAVVVA